MNMKACVIYHAEKLHSYFSPASAQHFILCNIDIMRIVGPDVGISHTWVYYW